MKEYQTSLKISAGSAEKRNRRLKDFAKSNKITKKRLNAAFASVSEDSVDVDFSSTCKISDANPNEDVSTFFLEEASSATLLPSDIMPSENITDEAGISSTDCFGAYALGSSKFTSVETEIGVNFFRNAQPGVLSSLNAAPKYRKLMDEITHYVIEDLHKNTLAEERDCFAQVLSVKNRMLFLCFCIWLIAVSAMLFFTSEIHCPSCGPLPT